MKGAEPQLKGEGLELGVGQLVVGVGRVELLLALLGGHKGQLLHRDTERLLQAALEFLEEEL